MLNRCEFIGRLGVDPEIRALPSGSKVANLRLAVSDNWRDKATGERKEKTEWIAVTIFSEGLVKVVEQYLKKGAQLYVSGAWQTRKWEKDGVERYSTECVLQGFDSKLVMLGGKQEGGSDSSRDASGGGHNAPDNSRSVSRDMDDEIPFAPEFR